MDGQSRFLISFLALAAFAAGVVAAVRGGFTYPVELLLISLIGLLLIGTLAVPKGDSAWAFLSSLFFLAAMANAAYMYSVAGYMSPARLGTLTLAAAGLVISGLSLMGQPAQQSLTSEAKKLITAEKKINDARKRLESIKTAGLAPSTKPLPSARRARKAGAKRRKR